MVTKILIFLLAHSFTLYAYQPTVESLFRNGNNIDIGKNTIIANLKITKKAEAEQETGTNPIMSQAFPQQIIKLYINNEIEEQPKLIQVNFNSMKIEDEEIATVLYRPSYEVGKLGFTEENIEGKFFYAILASVFNNDGTQIVKFLKMQGVPVKFNTEMINIEKLQLLQRYSQFLALKDSDSNIKNPLKAEDPEKQSIIDRLMRSSFYNRSPYVTAEREGESFFWLIKTSNFEAKIADDTRQLQYAKFNGPAGEIKIIFSEYLISGSNFETPRKMTYVLANKEAYELEVLRIQVVDEKGDSYQKRFQGFIEAQNKNNLPRPLKPSFLL